MRYLAALFGTLALAACSTAPVTRNESRTVNRTVSMALIWSPRSLAYISQPFSWAMVRLLFRSSRVSKWGVCWLRYRWSYDGKKVATLKMTRSGKNAR